TARDLKEALEVVHAKQDYTSYHVLFLIRRHARDEYNAIEKAKVARILASALENINFLNDWSLLVLLCELLRCRLFLSGPGSGRRVRRRQFAGRLVPVVDPRLLTAPQHATDAPRNRFGVRTRLAQQLAEDHPHLRHTQRRRFFLTAPAPVAKTTTPKASVSRG